jgi:histidinol phosphatase-like enzyme (inositol monophosphatase family)
VSALIEALTEVVRLTGEVALAQFGKHPPMELKADGTPVTAADRAAEKRARQWVEEHFPDDGIVGEEFGETRPGATRRWFIDPIDGTKTYIRGVPLWGTQIALVEKRRPLASAIFVPALGELIVAEVGQGCWYQGARCTVSPVDRIANATLVTTDERFANAPELRSSYEQLAARCGFMRSWGDCYGYLLVATGRADIMLDPVLSPWDAAPLQPIIVEAGGVLTDWQGTDTPWGGNAVATNRGIADAARRLLSSSGVSS